MKSGNVKTQRINIRVNNSEYDILKSKAKEANVSVSTYLREVGLHGKVNHLNNGKEIAQKIGSLHGKMQLYQHDMADQFNKIQNVLEENNQLLKSACGINNLEIADTLKYQNLRINSVLDTIMNSYTEHKKKFDEELQKITQF